MTNRERAAFRRVLVAEESAAEARYAQYLLDDGPPLDQRDPACWSWDTAAGSLDEFGGGACAICGTNRPPVDNDHDHDTGMRRGKLCRSCNFREGHARPDGDHIWTKYRRRNPASILGISERYVDPVTGVPDMGDIARRAEYHRVEVSPADVISSILDRGFADLGRRGQPTT